MILPYVLFEFTPSAVADIGLGAVCAAVMSSMDSSVLGSSSMFTYNIYREIFRKRKSSNTELLWVQRIAIFCIGATATVISMSVSVIYGMFILAADIVFVVVLPPLTCALFFKFTNSYGALLGLVAGVVCRIGAGEYFLELDHFIEYPYFHPELGQIFPFRTFSMLLSFAIIIVVSIVTNFLFRNNYLPQKMDILRIHDRDAHLYTVTSPDSPKLEKLAESQISTIDCNESSKQKPFHSVQNNGYTSTKE